MKKSTSWKKNFVWGEYQQELILPNLKRLVSPKKDEIILDLGCGAGFFAKELAKSGAQIIGVDISPELIKNAEKMVPSGRFFTGSAENLNFLEKNSVNKILMVLAIQNIDNVHKVFQECGRILKNNGQLFIVMNHPSFRIPKESDWGWDEQKKILYRRIDSYMSEAKVKIETRPSTSRHRFGGQAGQAPSAGSGQVQRPSGYTISFHRPLQFYFKLFNNNNFSVSRLEEWVSHKKSGPGPRAEAENKSRKEIPLFLFLEAKKIKFPAD